MEEWLMDLDSEPAASAHREEGNLTALLEGDSVTWTSSEASTTYTAGPPSMPPGEVSDLEWLEEDAPLSVASVMTLSTRFEKEKPKAKDKERSIGKFFLGVPLLLLWGWVGYQMTNMGASSLHGSMQGRQSDLSAFFAPKANPTEGPPSAAVAPARVVEIPEIHIGSEVTPTVGDPVEKPPGETHLRRISPPTKGTAGVQPKSSTDERSLFGFLAVDGPDSLTAYLGERIIGKGRFVAQLPIGRELLRIRVADGEDQLVPIRIKPGAQIHVAVRDEHLGSDPR
jgi:hypothetical protein